MLGASHRDHLTKFVGPNLNEIIAGLTTRRMHADDFVNERQALPRMAAALRAEHRVRTDHVRSEWKAFEEQITRIQFDGQYVCHEHVCQTVKTWTIDDDSTNNRMLDKR